MSDEEDSRRGDLAKQVLENEAYRAAFTDIEQEIFKKWQDARNPQDREHLHRLNLALTMLQTTLESTMSRGVLARREMERKVTLRERIGERLGTPPSPS